MQIDFSVELDYGDDGPGDGETSPDGSDVAQWVREGMERDGFPSVDVSADRAS